ncbi:MAG: epimerase/dehydratase, partial [Elusimicrobia bacterium]
PVRGTLFFSSSLAAAAVTTLYGVSKRAGELLCGHYSAAHGLDARALRLPVLLHPNMEPGGGGTGDFAVEMLREARGGRPYRCFLAPRTSLPFLHLSDAVRAALSFAAAAGARPLFGASVPGFSLTPERLTRAIRGHRPEFRVRYEVDPVRQAVADSWPARLGRTEAPKGWSFKARYGPRETVAEMLGVRRS